jgi:hypothetical protein
VVSPGISLSMIYWRLPQFFRRMQFQIPQEIHYCSRPLPVYLYSCSNVFRWFVFSEVVIQSNGAGRRRSDISLYKNVGVLVGQNLILVSRQNFSVCKVA